MKVVLFLYGIYILEGKEERGYLVDEKQRYLTFEDVLRRKVIKEYVIITSLSTLGLGGLVAMQILLHYR